MVGDISNNPKHHENQGFWDFNQSKLDLTNTPWSRIMRSPFWRTLFNNIFNKNGPKYANRFFYKFPIERLKNPCRAPLKNRPDYLEPKTQRRPTTTAHVGSRHLYVEACATFKPKGDRFPTGLSFVPHCNQTCHDQGINAKKYQLIKKSTNKSSKKSTTSGPSDPVLITRML